MVENNENYVDIIDEIRCIIIEISKGIVADEYIHI